MFKLELDYDDNMLEFMLEKLILKFREDAKPYLTGLNRDFLLCNYFDAFEYIEDKEYSDVQKNFLNFLDTWGTFSLEGSEFAEADFWDESYQIMMYKYDQDYLSKMLDVLDSWEFQEDFKEAYAEEEAKKG